MSRTQLLQLLGTTDEHEFGGYLITVSKLAIGAAIGVVIERSKTRNGNGPREYHYKIRDDIKTEVRAALNA